ncbi:tetratricopeptide repeat protein, partial [Enterococcus casseliflavus]|uniref:tetratricopeptide repeat protein n=1 Tax=Enterococcus casseliflavus TaxID=37734 RepID=UPI003D134CA3
ARVGKDLTGQPAVEADLRSTIGAVYHELGDFKKAAAMHREALGIRRELLGHEHSDVADSLASLGRALYGERRFAESEAVH